MADRARILLLMMVLAPVGALAADSPLSSARVVDYIETRIETHRLQQRMKRNADEYENLIQTFYKRRDQLLRKRGWTPEEFEATQKRIIDARNALDMKDDLREQKERDRRQIEQLRESGHIAEDKVRVMEREFERHHAKREKYLEEKSRDWPAIRPWVDELDQLTDWVAGNVARPPTVKR